MWRREAEQIKPSFFFCLMNTDTENYLANGLLGHTTDYIAIP